LAVEVGQRPSATAPTARNRQAPVSGYEIVLSSIASVIGGAGEFIPYAASKGASIR
jgi:hypothetical protein